MVDVTNTTYEVSVDDTTYDVAVTVAGISGTLNNVSDVTISSPTNGQTLAYNATSSLWTNSSAGAGDMTKAVYDPSTVEGDAFDMDNMVEGTNKILTAAERAAIVTNSAKVSNATHTGNVTGSTALTIANDAVTYAKMQNVVADNRILGNVGGADAIVAELTKAQVLTMINVEDGADVTDTTNVTAAGALMDSEVDADIKTFALPANTTISAFGATLVDDADASTARSTLDVDQAGTDNSTDVTLNASATTGGMSISTQEISNQAATNSQNGYITSTLVGNIETNNAKTGVTTQISNVVEDTTPQLGGNLDWNSNGMLLVGQTVGGSAGDLVYLSAANTWAQADADAEATCKGMMGINVSAATVLTHGLYTTTGLTAGSIYYASATAGGITTTAPSGSGDIVRIIGYALSTTELFFDPDKSYVELS